MRALWLLGLVLVVAVGCGDDGGPPRRDAEKPAVDASARPVEALRSCFVEERLFPMQLESPRVVRDIDRIFTTYFEELDERLRPTVERLINVVVEMLPDVEHKRKWGRITFTRNGDWHHWICAIALDRKAVGLVVHKGALLADPRGVLEGDGRYLRAITFSSPDDVDADVVGPILLEAVARQPEM